MDPSSKASRWVSQSAFPYNAEVRQRLHYDLAFACTWGHYPIKGSSVKFVKIPDLIVSTTPPPVAFPWMSTNDDDICPNTNVLSSYEALTISLMMPGVTWIHHPSTRTARKLGLLKGWISEKSKYRHLGPPLNFISLPIAPSFVARVDEGILRKWKVASGANPSKVNYCWDFRKRCVRNCNGLPNSQHRRPVDQIYKKGWRKKRR